MMQIYKGLKNDKKLLLEYFRDRAEEFLNDIKEQFGSTQYKEQANAINKSLIVARNNFITTLLQTAEKDRWTNKEKLECSSWSTSPSWNDQEEFDRI